MFSGALMGLNANNAASPKLLTIFVAVFSLVARGSFCCFFAFVVRRTQLEFTAICTMVRKCHSAISGDYYELGREAVTLLNDEVRAQDAGCFVRRGAATPVRGCALPICGVHCL
ncbi:hypothetical protein TRVL_10335 [Trypanosoma vivax]|nr:hypothetical protein TRVL_10335 [Trypanosoma vivax]